MDPFLNTFDDYVDDLITSDLNLLKGELDFLIFQHLFNSIDLMVIEEIDSQNKDTLAA